MFNLAVPTYCPGVPAEVLDPRCQWAAAAAAASADNLKHALPLSSSKFDAALSHLASLFASNFTLFLEDADRYVAPELAARILAGGPHLPSDSEEGFE